MGETERAVPNAVRDWMVYPAQISHCPVSRGYNQQGAQCDDQICAKG